MTLTLAERALAQYQQGQRLVAPLLGFPGVSLAHSEIKIAQQNFREHFKVIQANVDSFRPDLIFPLMDLSVEANALGRYTSFPRRDSATVHRDAFRFEELERLREIDISCDSRVIGFVETVKLMKIFLPPGILRGAYVIGPYSLAALILGAEETAIATLRQPDEVQRLCDFTYGIIIQYANLLIDAGAEVICILEPTAMMLSPKSFQRFSSMYVAELRQRFWERGANTVYHICGNTMHLIRWMGETGVHGISVDSKEYGVDMVKAAALVPETVALIGNVCSTHTMMEGGAEEVKQQVETLLSEMEALPNFILSTGCDLPQDTPFGNIQAFMKAGRRYRRP